MRIRAKGKEQPCAICESSINLYHRKIYKQCPHCNIIVHNSCAADAYAISCNGSYYCDQQLSFAPIASSHFDNDYDKKCDENLFNSSTQNFIGQENQILQ